MDEGRGASRGSPRSGQTAGPQAQVAARISSHSGQQLDLASGPQKPSRAIQRPKLAALPSKSLSFTLTSGQFPQADAPLGVLVSPRGTFIGPTPSSPGRSPSCPRPGTGGGLGLSPRLHINSPCATPRRSSDIDASSDGGPCGAAEANFCRSSRAMRPWDQVAGGVDNASCGSAGPEQSSRATAATPTGGQVIVPAGGPASVGAAAVTTTAMRGAGSSTGRPQPRSTIEPGSDAQEDVSHQQIHQLQQQEHHREQQLELELEQQQQPVQQQRHTRPTSSTLKSKTVLLNFNEPPSGAAAIAVAFHAGDDINSSSNDINDLAPPPLSPEARGSTGNAPDGSMLFVRSPEPDTNDGGYSRGRCAASSDAVIPRGNSNGNCFSNSGSAPFQARALKRIIECCESRAHPCHVTGSDPPAASSRMPPPSSMYGGYSSPPFLMTKLPPPRGSPRRGGTSSPATSSNGSLQGGMAQLQTPPYTPNTVAQLGTGPSETELGRSSPVPPVVSSAPVSPVRGSTVPSGNPPGWSGAAEAGAALAAGSTQGTSGLSEAQRAAQSHPNIEQILMGSAAAPSMRAMTPSSTRPDYQMQQAFRNLSAGKTLKMSARDDVMELQRAQLYADAALLRQVSALVAPQQQQPRGASPQPVRSSSPVLVGAGLRNAVGRQVGQAAAAGAAAAAALMNGTAVGRWTLTPENSRRTLNPHDQAKAAMPEPRSVISEASVGSGTGAAGAAAVAQPVVSPPAGVVPFSPDDVAFQPVLTRDADGFLLESLIMGQESALTTAISGLVVQANEESEELRHNTAVLTQTLERMGSRDKELRGQLATANMELDRLRQVVTAGEVDSLSTRLMEAQAAGDAARREELEAELYDVRQDQAMTAARAAMFESQASALATEVRNRTPRPTRSLGMLDELLSDYASEKACAMAALAAGAAPLELHRLMLGITSDGEDMNNWVHVFGAAQAAVPPWSDPVTHAAATAPQQDLSVAGAAAAALAATTAAATTTTTTNGGSGSNSGTNTPNRSGRSIAMASVQLALLSRRGVSFGGPRASRSSSGLSLDGGPQQWPGGEGQAVSTAGPEGISGCSPARLSAMGAPRASPSRPSTMGGVGGGDAAATARRQAMALAQQQAYMKRLHSWLVSLMEDGDVLVLRRLFPDEAVDAMGAALQLGVPIRAMSCWLLGCLSPGGYNFLPYKDLVGLLSRQFQHTPLDLGGPITSGLELASKSTGQRIKEMEDKAEGLHREVVRLKRCLADHKRAERARVKAEVDAKERKVVVGAVARERPVPPVHAFMAAKWSDFFEGLGCSDKVPKVLHAEGRVFNRRVGYLVRGSRRRMEKVDAEKLVNTIWAAKADWQSRNPGARTTLADFVLTFMQRKFVNPRTVTETAYNLMYTLGQHSYDPDCQLFIRVRSGAVGGIPGDEGSGGRCGGPTHLFPAGDHPARSAARGQIFLGEVDEGIRADGEELQADLIHMLAGPFRLEGVTAGFFPYKSRARFEELLEALDTEWSGSETIMYRRLFDADRDLNQGVFAETIRTQHIEERLEALQAIEDALVDTASKARVHFVPPSLLAAVLKSTVQDCNDECIRQYLRVVYGSDGGIRHAEAAAPAANTSFYRATAHSNKSRGNGGSPGRFASAAAQAAAAAAAAEARESLPTVEGAVALIRRGWVPDIPTLSPAVERGDDIQSLLTPRKVSWAAALGQVTSRGGAAPAPAPAGAAAAAAGGSGAAAAAAVAFASALPGWSPGQRAAFKRLRFLRAMQSVREAWLQPSPSSPHPQGHPTTCTHPCPDVGASGPLGSTSVEPVSAFTERRGSGHEGPGATPGPGSAKPESDPGSGAQQGPDNPREGQQEEADGGAPKFTLVGAAAAAGIHISSMDSLPTAKDFAGQEQPDLAALEGAQKILTAQLTAAAAAITVAAAGSGTAGAKAKAGIRGPNPAAAAAAVEEVGERLQRLRALGAIISTLLEEGSEVPPFAAYLALLPGLLSLRQGVAADAPRSPARYRSRALTKINNDQSAGPPLRTLSLVRQSASTFRT
ncbi:hypothetical protein VOLCADRAFT_98724 [Volvox carteri f. nagariensis]|uniref:Uncharacterized protein n=1 Tax=Volvox carteri f. nagariensis TaxID=3068 RepID=D8UG43_VOLCA|nr:uncharacterized protein VOLCADRAFT_98724 [Volvox carteri f. nagariensis]EFJ41312.1 hypothetical protein VOLCADRAFT_98724 [Volvox carteri f. nagariensis]|eukprot:XP_002957646.1 hypothetical protein VOLCADRAFT_98724 [Volvox carteri f. nagariensis]